MDSLACVGGQSRVLYSATCSAFVIICKVACGCLLLFLREMPLRMCYVRGRHGFKPAGESASSVDGSRTNVKYFAEYTPWVTTLIPVLRLARIVNHHAKIAHIQSALDGFVGCFFSIFLLGCCLFSFDCCE